MKVAVLGAGHGGQAMAAYLKISGHEVRLAAVPEHASKLLILKAFGGIYLEGITSGGKPPGYVKLDMITDNVSEAVKGVEVILIVVPAFAQEAYMKILVEHGETRQIIVFNPGKFACMEFAKMLKDAGRDGDLTIGETTTLLYAAKLFGAGHVRIKAIKNDLYFSTFPSIKTAATLWTLSDLFTQFAPAHNVLQTSLDDIGMILHPITTLMNTSRIEQMGPYRNAYYDITPSIGRVIETVDNERLELAKFLRVEALSFLETYDHIYGIRAQNACEVIRSVDAYKIKFSPDNLNHRYVSEEIPYSLVPAAEIAGIAGMKTPGMDCIIELASMANGVNYRKEGRSLEKLGLKGIGIKELMSYVIYGK